MTLEFKKDKMEYVYKYENINNTVVYVGITNNLTRRIREHQEDKLGEIKKPTIYYFPVKYRGDADMLETYLIDYYKTGKYYNVAKTKKGDFSFFDICNRLPWALYEGKVDKTIKPFVVTDIIGKTQIEKIKEPIYIDSENSHDKAIREYYENEENIKVFFTLEILQEVEIIKGLKALLKSNGQPYFYEGKWLRSHRSNECINRGLLLHTKRLRVMCCLLNESEKDFLRRNDNKIHRLNEISSHVRKQLEEHEKHKMNDDISSFEWDKAKRYFKQNKSNTCKIGNLLAILS